MTVRARIRGFDWTLEDASLTWGRTDDLLRCDALPLIVPGIVAAAMLSFAPLLDDFIITYFVSGSTVTYPLYVNAAVKAAVPPQINVLGHRDPDDQPGPARRRHRCTAASGKAESGRGEPGFAPVADGDTASRPMNVEVRSGDHPTASRCI